MTVIGSKDVAQMLLISEASVKDRTKPSCPRCRQIPHFALPNGGGKRRIIRFHREAIQTWIDAGCPSWDEWEMRKQ